MVATRSDQIRERLVQIPWSIFISKNYQNDISKWPDIKDDDQRCQVVRRYGVSKTSVSFRYQLRRLCDVLSWSVSLRYQLVRGYDVSNCSVSFTYQWDVTKTSQIGLLKPVATSWWCISMVWDVQISHWNGSISFAYYAVNFLSISGGSVSLRYQLVRCYNVSKTLVSFRYHLWRLRDVLS